MTMSPKLLLAGQPAAGVDGQRVVDRPWHGRRTDDAGRDLHVLLADGAITSPAARPRAATLFGSSQTRMA